MSSPDTNPYQASNLEAGQRAPGHRLKAPAIGLLAVSSLSLILNILSLAGSVLILALGIDTRPDAASDGPQPFQTTIAFRIICAVVFIAAALFVTFGSIKMLSLKGRHVALAATIVAMIPLLSPCFLLGIPFGIWAFIVLLRADVRAAFSSQ